VDINHARDVRLLSTAEEVKSRVDPDDEDDDNKNILNTSTDTQRQEAGEASEAGQWQLEYAEDESVCMQFHTDDQQRQSLMDDVHNCCADCGGGCYNDEISTFYINYQHQGQTLVNAFDSAPTLTGVQVCGPANLELLFLIDQLASTACFVDDPGAFMTLVQPAAAPAAASALYVDSSPRIVELRTDDESERITENLTERAVSNAVDSRRDNGLLNKDTDRTTPANATGCGTVEEGSKTSPAVVDCQCSDKQSEQSTDCRGQARRRQKRSGEQQEEKPDDAEIHVRGFESLRRPRVPDVGGNVGIGHANKDNELTTTTTARAAKRFDHKCHAAAGRQQQRRRLPLLDARTSTVSKADRTDETTAGLPSLHSDVGLSCLQRQQQVAADEEQRDKYKLPDVFVDRKPVLPSVAKRSEPSLGRGLRLPPANNNNQRVAREAPRFFPPPPQRRRSHPLAPRRPMTPANRNVLASRAVWPSMASGRPVEDEWTRRAAAMRRRSRLPPLQQTASVATWN